MLSDTPPPTRTAASTDLELPRPGRLVLSAVMSLAESFGLPVAAYLGAAAVTGRAGGMIAATAVIWLTAGIRKVATRTVPALLVISALVFTLQAILVIATGSELFFLLQFPLANLALSVLFARTAPTQRPLVAQLAAEVVALRQPTARQPGLDRFFRQATWLWAGIFAASTVGMGILLATESAGAFLLFTTAVTIGGVAAGTVASALWFRRSMRRFGFRVRFAQS
ncbi:MAG TPA: hypothetical protein VEH05_11175 [Streptosporangiaceae bacterium]|nr:hypothetical protein [Streptosporangiaceae bacterium]